MSEITNYFGIDISKDTFDVFNGELGHLQFPNTKQGFKSFSKLLGSHSHCLMEATWYYHYSLACYLLESSVDVSVENPLKIKRYIQMKLTKIKTDKADAKLIYQYAKSNELALWKAPNMEAQQLWSLLETYQKQSTQIKNKMHGEQTLRSPSKLVLQSLKRSLKSLQKEMSKLELALEEIVKSEDSDALARLQTIPGMGKKNSTDVTGRNRLF